MKQKKIKIKKNKKTVKETGPVKPRKTSAFMYGFIIATILAFFIIGYFVFGLLVAAAFTVMYILLLLLVRVIDKYPIRSKKRRVAKITFLLILLFGILGILAFIAFFISVILSAPDFAVKKLERNETSIVYDN